jgi:hypothetical protein
MSTTLAGPRNSKSCYGSANSPVIRRNLRPLWTAKPMPAPHRFPLLSRIAATPGQALAAVLLLHAAVWTALPTLLYPNLPLDLIEALVYGREWQLGYDKLPPLPWWLVEVVYRIIGHDFAYYLLAQTAVLAALWLVWLTARPMAGPLGALVAVLIVDGLHYLNYTAAKFNHDVIQLPFWALAGFAFHRAARPRSPALAVAWLGRRNVAMGEIFRGGAGAAAGAVHAHRPRCAQGAGDAGPLFGGGGGAGRHDAASRLAGAE